MKMKYLGAVMVGIMVVGSLTVMAKDAIGIEKISTAAAIETVPNDTYDYIRDMIDEHVREGSLTKEQADELYNRCTEELRSRNTSTNRSERGYGCH